MSHHITILAARYWPDVHGGVETHMTEFSRELARQGMQVHVLTENRTGAPRHERVMANLLVQRENPLELGRLWRWAPLMQVRWWYRLLKDHPPRGMIWASNTVSAVAAILAGYRDRLIYNPAGCCRAMSHIGKLYPHLTTMQLSKTIQRLDRFAYRRAKGVVVSSINVKEQYNDFEGPRPDVFIQPLAAATPERTPHRPTVRKQWGVDNDVFVIGFVGRLDPCKGLDFLFDAVQLAPLQKATKLLIVGDGPDKQRLLNRAVAMGIDHRIIWAGALKDPTAAYAAMDVLALPSIYEAFGMVQLEAMAMGVAVLSRRGNGRSVMTAGEQIIDHNHSGMLFGAHDPGDLAQQLHELERAPMKLHAMATAARFVAKQHTWAKYTRRCLRLLLGDTAPQTTERADEQRYRRAA